MKTPAPTKTTAATNDTTPLIQAPTTHRTDAASTHTTSANAPTPNHDAAKTDRRAASPSPATAAPANSDGNKLSLPANVPHPAHSHKIPPAAAPAAHSEPAPAELTTTHRMNRKAWAWRNVGRV